MIKNIKLILLLIIIYFNFINGEIINSFIVEDITPQKLNTYEKYPDNSNTKNCSFSFFIYTSCLNEGSGKPTIVNNSYTSTLVLSNDTSSIYSVSFIGQFSLTPENFQTLNITLSGCGYTGNDSIFQINYQCYEIDFNQLIIKNSDVKYDSLLGEYSIVTLKGNKYPLKLVGSNDFNDCGDGIFNVPLTCNQRNNYTQDSLIGNSCFFEIFFYNGDVKGFVAFQDYSNSKINIISNVQTFPDFSSTNSTFNQMDRASYPFLTFNLKSDVDNPFKAVEFKNKYPTTIFSPLYSDKDGSVKYLFVLFSDTTTTTNAYLFYQNNSFAISATNFNFSINDYVLIKNKFSYNSSIIQDNLFNLNSFLTGNAYHLQRFSYTLNMEYRYIHFNYPFGLSSGQLNNFQFDANIICSTLFKSISFGQLEGSLNTFTPNRTGIVDNIPPVIKQVEYIYIGNAYVLIQIYASDASGVAMISIDKILVGKNAEILLTSGTIYDGVFEIITDSIIVIQNIAVIDKYGNAANILKNSFYSINPIKYYSELGTVNEDWFLTNLNYFSFETNQMNITDGPAYNTIYFNFSQIIKYPISILINPVGSGVINIEDFEVAIWDDKKKLYNINFSIKKNSKPGILEFFFTVYPNINSYINKDVIYKKFPNLKPIYIVGSTFDLSGPIISNIINLKNQEIGWNITIEDSINGFSNGYVVVNGLIDGSIYNFTLQGNGEKSISFKLLLSNISCVTQTFQINDVILIDAQERKSTFERYKPLYSFTNANPLMNYFGNQDALIINVTCTPLINDTTPPTLISITPNVTTIDVSSNNRSISFEVVVSDLQSGINKGQNPKVYLSSLYFENYECNSQLKSCDSEDHQCTFKCEIEIPYAFAYPYPIIYQVYGIMNNNGLFSGYSTNKLILMGSQYNISTTFSKIEPVIAESSTFPNVGGEILIIGGQFQNTSLIHVKYAESNISFSQVCESQIFCLINLNGTDSPFTIQIETIDGLFSNIYKIKPVIVYKKQSSESSSSLASSSQEQPTCLGSPICGGPSKGYCSSKGCVCFEPWTGPQCLLKIIIVPQPSFNGTDPNITIIIPDDNDNEKNQYVSLTSIVALRELDINRNAINTIYFDKWINNEINSTFNQYYSNLTNINKSDLTTQTIVNIQWFTNQTNITFAGNHLSMNPYSIKYTIEIIDYPFQNQLNHLEIVMSTMFKSNDNNDNICSNQEFGDTNGYDQSNYLKIQVNDHSLYARFIKRGIIDSNNIVTVSNTILDKSFDSIETPKEIQSFIGISIPHFKKRALIDPDFSVLIDNSPSSYDNCNKSKLSKIQIAGIIIGCVGFAAVVAISSIVYYIKKRNEKIMISSMQSRLKSFS